MSIANSLGSHVVMGGLIAVLAGLTFLAWEYMRLERSGRWLPYALTMQRIAITLTVISVILMGSRFISVVASNGGILGGDPLPALQVKPGSGQQPSDLLGHESLGKRGIILDSVVQNPDP